MYAAVRAATGFGQRCDTHPVMLHMTVAVETHGNSVAPVATPTAFANHVWHHINTRYQLLSAVPCPCSYGWGIVGGIASLMVLKRAIKSIPLAGALASPFLGKQAACLAT